MFAKYIFSGILDRHPKLRIGWFEGGIAWVPSALQDAEHLLASYQHMFNHQLEHDIRYYWDTHMSASFMVDPLGLQLIDQIGVDKVMWSSDYPHNESTFGYSEKSLAAVVEAVGPDDAAKIVSGNIKKFLGIYDDDVRHGGSSALLDIPDLPDRARMYRESGARLRAAMADNGVDALILLGNGNVVYATGASWPLLDAGLSHVERPVAIVLADDEHPHLFMPFREGASSESEIPADHLHGPLYLEFDEGVEHFARVLAELIPAGATVAVDELTGAMRRAADRLFPGGPAVGRRAWWSAPAKLVKTPDQIVVHPQGVPHHRRGGRRRAEVAWPRVFGRSICRQQFVRRAFELGATANMLEAIWQVMPTSKAEGTWTTHGDLALPLLTTERELAAGDVLWTDVSITYDGYCSDFGRTWLVGEEPSARQQAQFEKWRDILDAVLDGDQGRRDVRRSGPRGDRRQRRHASRGCRTSTSATASAPTPPKCR